MIDEHAATELKLYIDNDGDLYRQMTTSILKNLATKKARGDYDSSKATKAFAYLVEAGAKKYAKEFGGTWHQMFSVPTRMQVSKEMRDDFESEWKDGSYRNLLPKKYQEAPAGKRSKKSGAQLDRDIAESLASRGSR